MKPDTPMKPDTQIIKPEGIEPGGFGFDHQVAANANGLRSILDNLIEEARKEHASVKANGR